MRLHDFWGAAQILEQSKAVDAGQHDIEEHQIEGRLEGSVRGLVAPGAFPGAVAGGVQGVDHPFADGGTIFDDEDDRPLHRSTLWQLCQPGVTAL